MHRPTRGPAVILASLLLVACGRDGEDHPPGHDVTKTGPAESHEGNVIPTPPGYARVAIPGEREQRFGVRTEPARVSTLVRTVRTVGIVREDERRVSTVRVKWSGWIEALHVSFVGQAVRKGDPLFSVYSPDLFVAQQEFVTARRRLDAARSGSKEAGMDLPAAQSLADAAHAKLRFWDVPGDHIERISKSGEPERVVTIVAPHDGTVLERPARPGLHVEPETDLYLIADLSMVWLVADLYEYEAPLVREGTAGRFQPVGPDPTEIPVQVAFVAPTVDPMTRTVKVRFDVPNSDGRLRPGAYGTLRLSIPLGTGLSAPADAVIDTGDRRVLFVRIGDGLFEPRAVKIGARADDQVQILEGLKEGEEVVIRGQFLLDSESRIRGAGASPQHSGH